MASPEGRIAGRYIAGTLTPLMSMRKLATLVRHDVLTSRWTGTYKAFNFVSLLGQTVVRNGSNDSRGSPSSTPTPLRF